MRVLGTGAFRGDTMSVSNGIFIKNIYYMLAYAFQTIQKGSMESVAVESFAEMYDLLAVILAQGIARQVKSGLYQKYRDCQGDVEVVRGKVNMRGTIRHLMANRHLVACEFQEMAVDNMLNRLLKTTILLLLRSEKVQKQYKENLRRELPYFSSVSTLDMRRFSWSVVRFNSNNNSYRQLINICQLIWQGLVMTTTEGIYKLPALLDDEERLCRLYEKFILAYYKRHYPILQARAAQIPWAVDDGFTDLLPIMQTDIHLQVENRVLIIDAKYYRQTLQRRYHSEKLHSQNLYQIFSYVQNRDYQFGTQERQVAGLLLYARSERDRELNAVYHIHGQKIAVRTLDLNRPFGEIAHQLDEIVQKYFNFPVKVD